MSRSTEEELTEKVPFPGYQNEQYSTTCNMAGVVGGGSKSESCQSDPRITMQVTIFMFEKQT